MSSRSYSYLAQLIGLAATFVVITTYAFSRGTANAIAFGIAIGLTVAASAAVVRSRSRVERGLAGLATVAAGWMVVVTAGVFGGETQRWLTFAAAIGIASV